MKQKLSRRAFMQSAVLATVAAPWLTAAAGTDGSGSQGSDASKGNEEERLPQGRIGSCSFSRLMLGGNLLSGHAHARDLAYVRDLMRAYHTEAKIRQTLELAESHGIDTLNSWVMDDNRPLFDHWRNGGRMKWIAQVRFGGADGFDQVRRAVAEGATAVHVTGDAAEQMLYREQFDRVGEMVEFIRAQRCPAGIGAHDLKVVMESERRGFQPDFYVKTLHTHDYFSAPRGGETEAVGRADNYWCLDPEAVVKFMAGVRKPWIAFKILAAGAIHPRNAFPYAFQSGADFILVGMFDWQIPENAALARRVLRTVLAPNHKRTRPWCA
ncbi:MAG: hypothetical protein WHT82_00455 [Limisphaera sp.]